MAHQGFMLSFALFSLSLSLYLLFNVSRTRCEDIKDENRQL